MLLLILYTKMLKNTYILPRVYQYAYISLYIVYISIYVYVYVYDLAIPFHVYILKW